MPCIVSRPGYRLNTKVIDIFLRSMEPDQSNIDSDIAEVRNKLRSLSRQISEDLDRFRDLHGRALSYIEDDSSATRRKEIVDITFEETSLLREHFKRINERKELLDELSELMEKRRLLK
jgi:Zn-dependent oligopeptidase